MGRRVNIHQADNLARQLPDILASLVEIPAIGLVRLIGV